VDWIEIKAFAAAVTFDNLDSDWSHIGWTVISFTWCKARSEETGINRKLESPACPVYQSSLVSIESDSG
jgi:hypothetical protein